MLQLLCAVSLDSTTSVGTSLAVPWVRRRTSTAGGGGSTPGWGTRVLHATRRGQKKKNRKQTKNPVALKHKNKTAPANESSVCVCASACVRERRDRHTRSATAVLGGESVPYSALTRPRTSSCRLHFVCANLFREALQLAPCCFLDS